MIRVIGFDLDDTLWDIGPVIARANRILFDWLATRYPRMTHGQTPESLHQRCLAFLRAHPEARHDLTAMRKAFLRELAQQADYAEDFVEEAFAIFYAARNQVQLYPDVVPVLGKLARQYALIALSNGNACIERVGLARYFRFALNAAEAGAGKPDPRMFQLALVRLGEPPQAMLHVGDHPEHDVLGAHNAGVRAVWINRAGTRYPEHLPPPIAQLPHLIALPGLLARLAS